MQYLLMAIVTLVSVSMPSLAYAQNATDITADSRIEEVTIYPSRAELTRVATLNVPAGSHSIVFEDLQRQLFPETLRVSGESRQDITIGALNHKVINHRNISDQRVHAINKQVIALEDQKRMVKAEKEALNSKKAFYDSLKDKAAEETRQQLAQLELNAEEWSNAADVLGKEYASINRALVEKDREIKNIDDQIVKLQQDMKQFRQLVRQTYTVSLPLEVQEAGQLTLKLSYQVPMANWVPVYDARLNTQTGDLNIIQYGSVTQTTGEDWTDVKVTLSTAQPQKGASLPDLPVWRVGTYSAPKQSRFRSSDFAESAISSQSLGGAELDSMSLDAMKQVRQDSATIETGGMDAIYKIPNRSTILSDGTESKLLIGPFEAEGEIEVHVKPQIANAGYLASRAKLNGESILLPGLVNLFRDKDFVGNSRFPLLRPGQEHVLYFGVDNQIAVNRDVLDDMSDKANMLWSENVLTKSFVTKIENFRDRQVKLVLTENIPVSNDKDVEITILEEQTTTGYESDVDNKIGHLVWKKDLAPKQGAEIRLGWQISWPKDENLNGL